MIRLNKRSNMLMLTAALWIPAQLPCAQQTVQTEPAPILSADAAKGRYLAAAGNCVSCHTAEGGEPFSGGVAFVTDFGTLYSTNITQHRETGIGEWSLQDFVASMRNGVRPDGTHLYPAFPYTAFTRISDQDLAALYAYLKTIPPVDAPAKPNELKFPYNLRPLLAIWKMLYFEAGEFAENPDRSAQWNRGAYLVEGLGHCGSCHTPRNFLGAEQADLALSGGVYYDKVPTGKHRKWSAVNLTPAQTGLAAWTADDLFSYLKTGLSEPATVYGPMNEVVMNSTRHLTDEDIRATVTYLASLAEITPDSGPAADAETMRAGSIVYDVYCGTCHLPTGLGGPPGELEPGSYGVPVAGSAVVQAADPSALINTILYGAVLPPPPFTSHRKLMEPLRHELSDLDVARVASFVRASWGNSAGAVTAEQVKAQR